MVRQVDEPIRRRVAPPRVDAARIEHLEHVQQTVVRLSGLEQAREGAPFVRAQRSAPLGDPLEYPGSIGFERWFIADTKQHRGDRCGRRKFFGERFEWADGSVGAVLEPSTDHRFR
jgi:hypothetical protein